MPIPNAGLKPFPCISVIMPTLNAEAILENCLAPSRGKLIRAKN